MEATSWPTAASSLDLNYVKLSVNYLLCKCVQQFTARSFNTACAQHQLRQLHATLAHLGHDMSSSMRFKMFVALLLVRCMDLMSAGSEAALHAVAQIAFDRNADRALPLDLLGELRAIVIKKISFENEMDFFVEYAAHMKEILFNFETVTDIDTDQTEEYTNERFYEEMVELIKERVKPNPSVVLEIANHYERLASRDLEAELCNAVLERAHAKRTVKQEPSADESSARATACVSPQARPSPAKRARLDVAHDAAAAQQQASTPRGGAPNKTLQRVLQRACGRSPALPFIPMDSSSHADVHDQADHHRIADVYDYPPRSPSPPARQQKPRTPTVLTDDDDEELDFNESDSERGGRTKSGRARLTSIENDATPSSRRKTPTKRPATPANHHRRIADMSTDQTDSAIDELVFGAAKKPAKHVSDTDDVVDDVVVAKKPAKKSGAAATTSRAAKAASSDEENNPKAKGKDGKDKVRKVPFTEEENLYLVMGVIMLGMGNWAQILQYFRDHFDESRTSVKLKDKYRTLQKNHELKALETRAQAMIKTKSGKR